MRTTILAAVLALAASAAVAQTSPNQCFQQFSIAVTPAAQGFTVASKVTPSTCRQATCTAWLVENDSTTATVYIRYATPPTATAPVATDDTGNTEVNQMRLKPGQAKTLSAWANTYVSIIGTAEANVRFEQTCAMPGS